MRKDEILVQIDGLLVIFSCIGKLAKDEVKLSPMIVDIRVILLLFRGLLEVTCRRISISCFGQCLHSTSIELLCLPSSRCMLARLM